MSENTQSNPLIFDAKTRKAEIEMIISQMLLQYEQEYGVTVCDFSYEKGFIPDGKPHHGGHDIAFFSMSVKI